MGKRVIEPETRHKAFRDDMIDVVKKHGDDLSGEEMLALSAHFVGQMIAMQDQRTMTPARAMEIVAGNIEIGNKEVFDGVLSSEGNA